MKTIINVIQRLNSALEASHSDRVKIIKEFQDEIWNDENIQDEKLNMLLNEIAYDLDFYEPKEEWRNESSSYYGDDRFEQIIRHFMNELKNLGLDL